MDGRYWLRLEWRALARALRESGEQRDLAVREALAFRQARRMLYAASVESERAAEITEGLAQYTGTVVAAQSTAEATASALDQLAAAETQESVIHTAASTSGTAYGLLLDAASPGWTRRVRSIDDLATLVMRALAVNQPLTPRRLPPDTAAPSSALPNNSASNSGRNVSPSCAFGLSTVRCF